MQTSAVAITATTQRIKDYVPLSAIDARARRKRFSPCDEKPVLLHGATTGLRVHKRALKQNDTVFI